MAIAITTAQIRIKTNGFKISKHHINSNDNTPSRMIVSTIFSKFKVEEFVLDDSITSKF
jgi:hypothetical protein